MVVRSPVDEVIQRLEAQGEALAQNWCVPREAGRFLCLMVKMLNAQSVCEVGTSIGYSTLWLAKALEQTGGHLETIDYYASRQDQAKEHLAQAGVAHRVTFLQGDALKTLQERVAAGQRYDLVFVDAAKQQYLGYLKAIEPALKPGALIIADNTQSHRASMQDFLDYLETSEHYDVAELETANGQILAWVKEALG